jgi:type I restriction enzyme S subunit
MSTATTHIETEKQRVPAMRFNEFDGDWNLKELKEICSFFSGGTPTSTDKTLYSGDIPFIGSGNIYDSKVSNYITEKALNNSSAKLVEVGDLLYALYGANSGEVAISKMYGAVNQAILCIRTKSEKIDFVYSLLFLNKEKIVTKYLQGGQGNLSANIIKNLKYHFPSLPEQQKIASFLAAVDEKIQQLTKKKALLADYKKGVMQQLFSGQLRFKDENGKDYPDWEEKRLGEIVSISSGISPSSYELKEEGSIPFLKVEELNNCSKYQLISRFYAEQGRNIVPKGSVVFPKRGAAILNNKVRITAVDAFMDSNLMALQVDKDSDNEFLYYFLIKKQLFKIADTSTIPQINNKHIEPYPIRLPSLPEQQKIATYLSGIDTKIEAVNTQITQTQTFKKGLLQQLFV